MPANAPSALLSRHHRLSRLSCLSRLLRCLLPGVLLRCFLLAAFCFAVCLFLRLHAAACSAATCIAVSCSPPARRPALLLPAPLLPACCLLLRCLSLSPPTRCCLFRRHLYCCLLLASCPASCSAAPSGRSELVPASVPGTSGFAPSSPPLFLSTSACSYSFSSVFTASSFMVFSRRFVCRLLLLFPPFRRLPLLPFLRSFLLFRRFPALSACPPPVLPPPIRKHPRR